MPTVEASGTILATGSEQTLGTIVTNRNLLLVVDLTNLQAGDSVTLKMKRKVLSADAAALIYARQTYSGVQADPLAISIPIPSPFQAVFTLQQIAGVNRNFNYSVESI